jgi:hypothetical protein
MQFDPHGASLEPFRRRATDAAGAKGTTEKK